MANEVKRILSDIQKLAPEITARATEIEAARTLPPDLIEKLKSIGIFRICVPRSHGGFELDLPEILEIIEALSKTDGAIGWTAGIAAGGPVFASLLPPVTFDLIFRENPDTIFAGTAQPSGTAEPAPGGWRVSGRWPFASGCQHADWMVGFCVMTEDGKPLPGPAGENGQPLVKGFVLPARYWQIEDTWHAAGLKGTGSHHVALHDAFVSEANFFDLATSRPCIPGPLYQAPQHYVLLTHSPMALGIAQGALDDLIALARSGRQQQRAPLPLRNSEIFQYELGRIAADLKAARAFYQVELARYWRHALAGTLRDEALLVEGLQSTIWITAACLRVADACFALGGSSTVYGSSPLQRRMRDLHAVAQHHAAQQRHYLEAGKLLLNAPSN
jgi:indole-3-acetate monooxygenase